MVELGVDHPGYRPCDGCASGRAGQDRLTNCESGFQSYTEDQRRLGEPTMGPGNVKAVVRTATLFDRLSWVDGTGATLTLPPREAGLTEPTALRHLNPLVGLGLVERDGGSGHYRLGIRPYQRDQRALGTVDPRRLALPFMQGLLDRYGETVNMGTLGGSDTVLIEVLEGTQSLRKGSESELGLPCAGTAVFDRRDMPTSALSICGPLSGVNGKVTAAMSRDLIDVARRRSRHLGSPGALYPPAAGRGEEPAQNSHLAAMESHHD